jgi:hypothetical protein
MATKRYLVVCADIPDDMPPFMLETIVIRVGAFKTDFLTPTIARIEDRKDADAPPVEQFTSKFGLRED